MTERGVIEVKEEWQGDVPPSGAVLKLRVTGERLFTGDAALDRADKVSALRRTLVEVGIAQEDVRIASVQARVHEGLFGRSSDATYVVAAHCRELQQLPAALEAVVSQKKKIELHEIDWEYESVPDRVSQWIARCIKNAAIKADAISHALNVKLGPVVSCREETFLVPESPAAAAGMRTEAFASRSRMSLENELSAAEFAPFRRLGVRVNLTYAIVQPGG